jgi:hypothetical protein
LEKILIQKFQNYLNQKYGHWYPFYSEKN